MRRTCGWLLGALAVVSYLIAPAPASAAAQMARSPAIGHLLLSGTGLPQGWKQQAVPKSNDTTKLACLGALETPPKGWHHRVGLFVSGKGLPFVSEGLATGPGVARIWRGVRNGLVRCRSATITINGKVDRAQISRLSFSTSHATTVVASHWQLSATGLALGIDVFIFHVHRVLGVLSYTDVGTADAKNAAAFATAAIAKADGGSGTVTGVVDVATAPVRVAHTRDGAVGYRTVGSGPPLVLVMGFAGTMETWEPAFVDALAHEFEVVLFDNAGVGRTAALRAPLTIDAMAQQTSALVSALHLGAPDVLGWSMGGLIAEAFAALHPAQVHRLVLCATYPGTGALRAPQSAVDDLEGGGSKALAVLFPPAAGAAAAAFGVQTSQYLVSTSAPPKVVAAQAKAILGAWAGQDPGLRRFRHITAPTLVADGTVDRLVPLQNAHRLVAGVHGSKLALYKGAGHAFLFQDAGAFVPAVESFLAG